MRKPNLIAIALVFVVISALIAYLVYNGDNSEYHITTDYTDIEVDETTQLTMENDNDEPVEKDDKNLKWESADEDVATVDSYGLVTGVDNGTVEIKGTYKKRSAVITITVGGDAIRVSLSQESIRVGQSTQATFETEDDSFSSDDDLKWESSNDKVARIDSSGLVTGLKEGTATLKGIYKDQIASAEIEVTKTGTNIDGLDPVEKSVISDLPDDLTVGPWKGRQELQGLEWNTDKMDRFYVCTGSLIDAYDANGKYINSSNDVGEARLMSIDYYDGKVFSVMRSSSYGKFKLRVYDAYSLKLLVSTDLTDIHDQYSLDMEQYRSSLIPCLDGIMVCPEVGGGDDLKIYISYNVYYSKEDNMALHEQQMIFEYNFSSIGNSKEVMAGNVLGIDLGPIKHGIQTLEYDRSTGNVWIAVRKGLGTYTLFCFDWTTRAQLKNGTKEGWDCVHAGDGFCSLGNDYFYVLIPDKSDKKTTAMIVKVKEKDLEYVG